MIYEIDKYTDFLINAGITPDQFYICWLIYTKDEVNQEKYVTKGKGFESTDFELLIEKGWLVNTNPKAKAYNMINLFVSPEFAEMVLIEPDQAWDELFDAYPAHLLIEGKKVPAKTLNSQDYRAVEETYKKYINKNKFLHARVIAAVNKWKSDNNGYATIKIDKFVMGKYWDEIEKTDDGRAKTSYY